MGRTREQKAAYEARIERLKREREEREEAVRNAHRYITIDQVKNALVVFAWRVSVDGKEALPEFENAERMLASMRRAEEILEANNVKSLADIEPFLKMAEPLTPEQAEARGKARWLDDMLQGRNRAKA